MERTDLEIIWMGKIYPYPNVSEITFGRNPNLISFKDENDHRHTYNGVVYHIETYWMTESKEDTQSQE